MEQKPLVSIIIPTFNNWWQLKNCVYSIISFTAPIYEIIIINNGDKGSVPQIPNVQLIETEQNLGWMGGINRGLEVARGEYILFLNDDTQIPDSECTWLEQMVEMFDDKRVGAVGPISNFVMGTQSMYNIRKFPDKYFTTLIIGFCMLVRRSVIDDIGTLDESLPGGDDLDYCIRIMDAGYYIGVTRKVFVFHHGCQTGPKINPGMWNSEDSIEKTNLALIRKHGIAKWNYCLSGQIEPYEQGSK